MLAKVQRIEDKDTELNQVSLTDGFTNTFFFYKITNYWEEQDLGITRLSDAVDKQMHKIPRHPDCFTNAAVQHELLTFLVDNHWLDQQLAICE